MSVEEETTELFPSLRNETFEKFCEKTELLIVEVPHILADNKEISKIICTIIVHQSSELLLKAICLFDKKEIYEAGGNKTISYDEALKRSGIKSSLNDHHFNFQTLNMVRNSLQHHATITTTIPLEKLIINCIISIKQILSDISRDISEINLVTNMLVEKYK